MSAPSRRALLGTGLAGLLASLSRQAWAARAPLRIGDPVPDLVLQTAAGGTLRLATLRGQVLVVNFFASYCGPCRAELPLLIKLVAQLGQERAPGQPAVALIPIGVDADPAASARFAKSLGVPAPVLLDGDGAARAALDPQRFPCTFLIDAQGVVRNINRGFGPGYRARIERWLRRLLG